MSLPAPGAHGGDGARVAAALGLGPDDLVDLSLSLNPLAPDPRPVLARHLDALTRYPDPSRARAALADAMGMAVDRLLLTNGGAEAIALVAGELGGSVVEPEFSLHPRGAGPRWRSNPHNPTGRLAGPDEPADVWDEAFYALATGTWTRGDPGAVVVGSLTKLLACPGLRVGYVLTDPELVERCAHRQPAWSVNGLVAGALDELLAAVDLARWAQEIAALRVELLALCGSFGLAVRDTDANWILVDAPGLRERLAPHGVLVRDCASFGLPGVARVAVPRPDQFARVRAALERALDPSLAPPVLAQGDARK